MTSANLNRRQGGRTRRLRLPSPAFAIALLALFVSLGGTSYALSRLPANSVGSKQLKKNAVTTKKIKNGAVTSGKIQNGAVTAGKINPAGLTVPKATIGDSPVAWAEVGPLGGLVNGRGISSSNITFVSPGFFCFHGLPFAFKSAAVTNDYGIIESPDVGQGFTVGNTTGDCNSVSGLQAEVATWFGSTIQGEPFYIQFFN